MFVPVSMMVFRCRCSILGLAQNGKVIYLTSVALFRKKASSLKKVCLNLVVKVKMDFTTDKVLDLKSMKVTLKEHLKITGLTADWCIIIILVVN